MIPTSTSRSVRARLIVAAALTIIALLVYAATVSSDRAGFASSEVQFADASQGGALIVPASCPSNPHYAGECSGGGGGGGSNNPPAAPSSNACIIALSPSTIVSGQSAFMGWSSTYAIFGIPFVVSGTITPTPGAVADAGVTTVNPTQTTTYSGTFTPSGSVQGIPQSWLTPVNCSAALTVLTSAPGAGACAQVNFCNGSALYQQQTNCTDVLVQQCPYGCSNGACQGAAAPTAFIRAVPSLVRAGEQSTISWSSSNAASCNVTSVPAVGGTPWSGLSGSQDTPIGYQTTFTLSCLGLNGSTINRSAVVDILPVFCEVGAPDCDIQPGQ
ncbi:MAG: hypothetical protein HYS26_01165 [Candidatus Kaiserbacteria bacterium]|nr:MAG: hypothetical protein HYS26_01165 [Candidatus Kaiserbacteria bacterium]